MTECLYALASHIKAFQLLFIKEYCQRGFRIVSVHNMLYNLQLQLSRASRTYNNLLHWLRDMLNSNWKLNTILFGIESQVDQKTSCVLKNVMKPNLIMLYISASVVSYKMNSHPTLWQMQHTNPTTTFVVD